MNNTPNWAPGTGNGPYGPYGSTTLKSLVEDADRRLEGAATFELWSQDELEGLAQLGYEQFCSLTRALCDTRHIPERHSPAPTTDHFAREEAPASRRIWRQWSAPAGSSPSAGGQNVAQYDEEVVTASEPVPFLGDTRLEARQDGLWGTITSGVDLRGAGTSAVPPMTLLPPDVDEVERVTYDGRRLQPLTNREAEKIDTQWEQYTGYPSGYTVTQRGPLKLLKRFRGPAEPGDTRPYTQETGLLRGGIKDYGVTTQTVLAPTRITLTEFALQSGGVSLSRVSNFFPYPISPLEYVVVPIQPVEVGWVALTETSTFSYNGGNFGLPRQVYGAFQTGGPYGFPKRWNPGAKNTRVDYIRKAPKLSPLSRLEIYDWDARYVLFFVLSRAYAKDCPGQNLKAAEHFQKRWELGVEQVKARHARVRENLAHVMGGGLPRDPRDINPTAQLPANYPRN